jgi:hypothetical protein
MDARLVVALDAPSGARGIVATAPITADDIAKDGPPIRVPEEPLYLRASDAARIMQPLVDAWWHNSGGGNAGSGAAAAAQPSSNSNVFGDLMQRALSSLLGAQARRLPPPPIADIEPSARLALLLAHERAKGGASFWSPYIASLPDEPPCAWLLRLDELRSRVRDLLAARNAADAADAALERWVSTIERAGRAPRARAASLAATYGPALGVDAADVEWALAQVVSRAFGGGDDDVALAPLIDSCNHDGRAALPFAVEVDGATVVCVSPCDADGNDRGLAAGEELFIRYGSLEDEGSAVATFTSFGFVPATMRLD